MINPFIRPLKERFERWIDRRIPQTNELVLHHRQTFILPSRYGYLMLFIMILMMIAATNYQNSLAFLLTFTLVSIGFNVIILTYRNLTGLKLKAKTTEPIYAGQYLDIPILVSTLEDRHYYSIGFGTTEKVQQVINLSPTEQVETSIRVLPEDRGWYRAKRFYTVTVYPFGMLRVWSWFKFEQPYLVYPTPVDPGMKKQKLGGKVDTDANNYVVGEEDFSGIRSYRKGDQKRKIHWRAFAREQGLHTMEFVEPEGKSSMLDFDAFEHPNLELRLSWLCFLVNQCEASGERYGLTLPSEIIDIDHGSAHRARCLKSLALFQVGQQE